MISFFTEEGASDVVITWNEDAATPGLYKMGATMKFVTTVDTSGTGTTTGTSDGVISKVKDSFVAKTSSGSLLQTAPAGASVVPVTDITAIESSFVETVEVNGAIVPTTTTGTTGTTTEITTPTTPTVTTENLTTDIAITTGMTISNSTVGTNASEIRK